MFFILKNVIRLVVSLVCLSPIIVPLLAIERKALVTEADQQAFDGVGSAAEILRRFDPRDLSSDTTTKVSVSDAEITHAIGAVLSRVGTSNGRVQVAPDGVVFQGTTVLPIPETPLGRFLNVEAKVAPSDRGLNISSLSVGSISVAGWVIKPVAVYFLDWFVGQGKGEPIYSSIRSVEVRGNVITVGVQPPAELVSDVKAAASKALKLDDAEAIRSYYLTLVETSLAQSTGTASLATYLGPLFAVAQERSQSGDPVQENRAVILAMAMYFGDSRFQALLRNVKTDDADDRGFDVAKVKLERRHDWVQHFTTSAAIQVAAGSTVSNMIGEGKEVRDADGPSGFSFTDMAADRAGVRFAEVATTSEASARGLQSALAAGAREADFFPRVGDLPEGLSEKAFKVDFGDIGSPAYEAVVKKIDARIGKIALYN